MALPQLREALMSDMPVATRKFTLDDGGGRCIEVLLYSPVEDGQDYRCKYEIKEQDQLRESYAIGVDSLQALILALQKLGADITFSEYGKARRLYWNNQNDDLGLLLPRGEQS
jgi:hypothetical protein